MNNFALGIIDKIAAQAGVPRVPPTGKPGLPTSQVSAPTPPPGTFDRTNVPPPPSPGTPSPSDQGWWDSVGGSTAIDKGKEDLNALNKRFTMGKAVLQNKLDADLIKAKHDLKMQKLYG